METLDDLLESTGGFGRFQLYMLLALSLPTFCAGWSIMQIQFIDVAPDFYCITNDFPSDSNTNSLNLPLNVCSVNGTPCNQFMFINTWLTTVTKWDLVCDRKWIKKLLESLQLGGLVVGCLLAGQLSDWYGRKKAFLGLIILTSISNLFAAFSFSWKIFGVSRIFLGIGAGGLTSSHMPYTAEFLTNKWRSAPLLIPAFSIGVAASAGVEALIPNMLYLHLIVGCLSAAAVPGLIFLPEGPRWLTIDGQISKAQNAINKIAAINKKSLPKNVRTLLTSISREAENSSGKGRGYSILLVFASWSALKVTCIGGFVMMCNSAVFTGISYGISDLAGNIFLNIFIMASCSIFANMSLHFFNNRLGRRVTVFLFHLLATFTQAGCLLVLYATHDEGRELTSLITVFCVLTTLNVNCAMYAFLVWSVELYPTMIRNIGCGCLFSLYRVGGIIAPFAIDLSDRKRLSFIFMGTLMLLSTLFVMALPETKDKIMDDYTTGSNSSKTQEFSESDRLPILNKSLYCDDMEAKKVLNFHKK